MLLTFFTRMIFVAFVASVATSCSQAGKSSSGGGGVGSGIELTGNVVTQTGGSAELEGWVIGLLDSSSGEMRTAEVDSDGTFTMLFDVKEKVSLPPIVADNALYILDDGGTIHAFR